MDLTTATPQEIDAELYKIQIKVNNLHGLIAARTQTVNSTSRYTSQDTRDWAQAQIDEAYAKLAELRVEASPFNAEFERRGGWTRAFLVVNNGTGHVHRTMACPTCYSTTQFHWVTDLSDHSEQEIVDAAGERACTVCYASAPVELRLGRKTTIFSDDEKRKLQEREARASKKAAAEAAKILVEGYRESSYSPQGGEVKVFKTARAATNDIAGNLSSLTWYGMTHPSAERWVSNIEAVRKALAAVGVEYDYDKALVNARKRTVKEGGVAKF